MGDIELAEKVDTETPKPKELADVVERYLASQKELMEILIVVFLRLNKMEG